MLFGGGRRVNWGHGRALLFVLRNNGECWGRLVLSDGEELDVVTSRDYYDQDDLVALSAFARAAKRGRVQPAVGWLGLVEGPCLRPRAVP